MQSKCRGRGFYSSRYSPILRENGGHLTSAITNQDAPDSLAQLAGEIYHGEGRVEIMKRPW